MLLHARMRPHESVRLPALREQTTAWDTNLVVSSISRITNKGNIHVDQPWRAHARLPQSRSRPRHSRRGGNRLHDGLSAYRLDGRRLCELHRSSNAWPAVLPDDGGSRPGPRGPARPHTRLAHVPRRIGPRTRVHPRERHLHLIYAGNERRSAHHVRPSGARPLHACQPPRDHSNRGRPYRRRKSGLDVHAHRQSPEYLPGIRLQHGPRRFLRNGSAPRRPQLPVLHRPHSAGSRRTARQTDTE